MHVLVGGGSGFIGKYLCKYLRQKGHTVTLVSRKIDNSILGAFFDAFKVLTRDIIKCTHKLKNFANKF